MVESPPNRLNAFTIDVEDYWNIFHRDWLGQNIPPTDAVVRNTQWFLQILDEFNTKATFFILGEVAESFPDLVRTIAQAGHEIGVHGYHHRQIFKLTRDDFHREVAKAKKLLEDITGNSIHGHRAPAFSINQETQWALEVLAEEGFIYDSSVFPIAGKRYGWPEFSPDIQILDLPNNQSIIEAPLSIVRMFGKAFPAGGGGYIRHFPYFVTRQALRSINKQRPAIVYCHPYEIDITPKSYTYSKLSLKSRCKAMRFHYVQLRNRRSVKDKMRRLLQTFFFTTLYKIICKETGQ
ncbi:MAG: DUF3473 domain-containing protein [Sedimentisphaerales bacterium]|nr:DUF3473 domain-containing protein [Sedimentisphaerales bacterium]